MTTGRTTRSAGSATPQDFQPPRNRTGSSTSRSRSGESPIRRLATSSRRSTDSISTITQSQALSSSYSFRTREESSNHFGPDEIGDGGDSDEEGADAVTFAVGISRIEAEVQESSAIARAAVIGSDVFHYRDGSLPQGSVNYPKPPLNYVRTRKEEKGEAAWAHIDNPGGWHSYFYKAKLAKANTGGQYTHHQLPSGCTPVPASKEPGQKKEPIRVYKGWRFHYLG